MKTTFNFLIIITLMLLSNIVYSQSVPSYVPTNGLVGWWGFNGNVQDGSGNGNHGTVNGAVLTDDRFGNLNSAYSFNGSSSYIKVNNSSSLESVNLSISFWIQSTGNQFQQVFYKVSPNTALNETYSVPLNLLQPGTINFDLKNNNCNPGLGWQYSSSFIGPVSNWSYFTLVHDGSTSKIYRNGQLLNSFSRTFLISNCPGGDLLIGCDWQFNNKLNGKLDDIGIWNRALTPQEITNLYNSQLPIQTSLCLPTITTISPSSVGVDSVVIGGNITNDGGSSIVLRGVCYSASPNPNMGNSRTVDGSGMGSFNTVLRGLTSSTTYYARSYAKNSNGVVVYGNEVNFTTSVSLPGLRCPGTPTVTDIDGNLYPTVQIGNQCWTQSNLKVSKYRNGDSIPTGLSNSDWWNTTSGAYGIYNNDLVNDGLYGKLYNHYSVTDSRGLCPTGWHVPTDGEWNVLVKHLDPNSDTVCICAQSSIAGGAMKSTSMQPTPGGWNPPNIGATNSSSFTALPGGFRNGQFFEMSSSGFWWSSSASSGSTGWFRILNVNTDDLSRLHNALHTAGLSVRCLKNTLPQVNTTSITNVTPSTALATGDAISEGGDQNTVRGFCYSITPNPTISNDTTINGTGIGVYLGTLQNLTPSTTYYVRTYATNSVGTSYGSELNFTTSSLAIGSNFAGGIVFYVDSSGQHGLVCAPLDQGSSQWGCHWNHIFGTSTSFGTGQLNTNNILANCNDRPIAASICDSLVLNGYSDWFLPSYEELVLMRQNLQLQNLGSFSNTWYWSSSQLSQEDAYGILFNPGLWTTAKWFVGNIRAVRSY